MEILEPGHVYWLAQYDEDEQPVNKEMQLLRFVNREEGHRHSGTQTQEAIRALIDRTIHCDNCIRWEGNDEIVYHLRMALVLHEVRAILRKVHKGQLLPEHVKLGKDGHFHLEYGAISKMVAPCKPHDGTQNIYSMAQVERE